MPLSVKEIFSKHKLPVDEKVQWGQTVKSTSEGIYIVAIASNEDELACIDDAPLCEQAISNWIMFVRHNGSNILVKLIKVLLLLIVILPVMQKSWRNLMPLSYGKETSS